MGRFTPSLIFQTMVNTLINIYFHSISKDEEGNPINTTEIIDIYGHIEIKSVKTIKQDEGKANVKSLSIRVTDPNSIAKIKEQTTEPDYLIWDGINYNISEIRKYYTYIEIISE